jgi:hypothetical protein
VLPTKACSCCLRDVEPPLPRARPRASPRALGLRSSAASEEALGR